MEKEVKEHASTLKKLIKLLEVKVDEW
jgi:hypothetical protein